jgi:Ca2+-binding EF-hand superfamily protein
MGNKVPALGSPKTLAFNPDSSMRAQYKRALTRIPRSKVPRIKQIFDELKRQSSTSGERVDKASFLRYFPLPGMMGERLFAVFDRDANGSIDFPEFLTGLSLIYHGTVDDKKKFLFDMYDLDGNGEVSKDELMTMLSYIPAAFRVLELHDIDEETMATAVASYKPTEDSETRIRQIVNSVFDGGKQTLSFEEFKEAISRNSAISEIINIFYDEAMPENELGIDTGGVIEQSNSGFLPLILSRANSSDIKASPVTSPVSPRCRCPLCEASIQFVHCIRCGSLLRGNKPNITVAADLQASYCDTCGLELPEPRHCFSCGHPLKSTLDQREESEASSSDGESETGGDMTPMSDQSDEGSDSSVGIVISGFLSKIGRATQTRQTRFFVLRDCFLYYYKREPPAHRFTHPRGVIFLSGLIVSSLSEKENEEGRFGFILKTGAKKRSFFCSDEPEQTQWVQVLQKASRTRSVFDFYSLDLSKDVIGRGKFSTVYAARSKQTSEEVAVKVIESVAEDAEDREFLRTELAIVKLVNHPNIVRTIDVFESLDKIFIVLERVHGGDLLARLQRSGRMSEFEGKRTIWALATAIRYLHSKGIIHRDIKPENVLITEEGTVKVTDFGLSALVPHSRMLDAPLGTVGYAAPEVLRSIPYDRAVDLWSLGAVTYVVLSGSMPFKGKTDKEVASAVLKGKFTFTHSVWDNVSESAKDFITSLLVRDPTKRMSAERALAHDWLVSLNPATSSSK